jgi:hypothetical protein
MSFQLIVSSLLLGALAAPVWAEDTCAARSGERIVPLVELYTSEGCSSCPPADRWLSAQIADTQLNWLAFHVDYWDYIGWADRFADPKFSARQRQRVNATGGITVYTPQVMVGTNVRISWQSANAFEQAVRAVEGPAPLGLGLSMARGPDGVEISLTAQDRGLDGAIAEVWLARYANAQASRVKAGENSGATLHHDRVVAQLWGPWRLEDSRLARSLSVVPDGSDWGLVAFAQDAAGRTLQSLGLSWKACANSAGKPTQRGSSSL